MDRTVAADNGGHRHQIEDQAVEFRTDDGQLLGLWTATWLLGAIPRIEDRGDQAELVARAHTLLTAFVLGLQPLGSDQTAAAHPGSVLAGSRGLALRERGI